MNNCWFGSNQSLPYKLFFFSSSMIQMNWVQFLIGCFVFKSSLNLSLFKLLLFWTMIGKSIERLLTSTSKIEDYAYYMCLGVTRFKLDWVWIIVQFKWVMNKLGLRSMSCKCHCIEQFFFFSSDSSSIMNDNLYFTFSIIVYQLNKSNLILNTKPFWLIYIKLNLKWVKC